MNVWYFSAHDQPKGKSARTYDFSKELVRRGHSVTMFTNSYCHWTHEEKLNSNERWRVESIDKIRVVWMKTIPYKTNGFDRGLNMISNAFRSIQVSRYLKDKPDVVIGPSVPIGTGWAALQIAKMKNAAFVYEVRDVWPIALVYDGGLSKYNPVYYGMRLLEKHLYKKSNRISATMPFLKQHVKISGGDPEKVFWIPNGVDFEKIAEVKEYSGGRELPLVAMYVGGYGEAHDVITIIQAAQYLREQGDNRFKFVLVGNGVKRAKCQEIVKSNSIDNVEFIDAVEKKDVPIIQAKADVLIACVTNSEAYQFGLNLNKLFDYFASARPVIFSGNAPNDPVEECGAGYSIPPENTMAMVKALDKIAKLTPAERKEIGLRGRVYVEDNYNIKTLGERMETLLMEAESERVNR